MTQQSSTTWDLRAVPAGTLSAEGLYFLFLLLLLIGVVLVLIWLRVNSPSELTPETIATHTQRLNNIASSLKQWIGFTFLAFGFLVSHQLSRVIRGLEIQRLHSSQLILSVARALLIELQLTFLVLLFVFLIRWHILLRIRRLRP